MNAYLGLGSNLGDRFANLQEAINRIGKSFGIRIAAVSPVYETLPVGGPEQPDYLNAVAEVETSLEAQELLNTCLSIEHELGRMRKERWSARTIDIDLLLFGEEHIRTDRLTVPHPRMHERAFVLCPLADIAPQALHPLMNLSTEQLLCSLDMSGVKKVENCVLRWRRD